MLSIGLMSGTSMDGINAALLKTDGKSNIEELAHNTIPYDIEMKILLKAAELATRQSAGNLSAAKIYYPQALRDYLKIEFNLTDAAITEKLEQVNHYFHGQKQTPVSFDHVVQRSTELHSAAVKALLHHTQYAIKEIDVIGYHGQTLFHHPAEKITIQIGNGKLLAELTGVTTVNDFRSHDVAMGGQGAPFAPLYHHALALRDKKYPAAVVNCGGISNITVITDQRETHVIGFDTGPGNGLIDRHVRQRTQNKEQMDTDGHYGRDGKVHDDILQLLYEKSIILNNKNFFDLQPPKSLDIGDLQLIPELNSLSLQDACRTLEAFTADSIVKSIDFFNNNVPTHWILSGGGWHNPVIKHELEVRLKRKMNAAIRVMTADEAGWNSEAMEAQIFAYLAVRSLHQLPISTPGTTRVPRPLTGGLIHQP
jgi:anhydro-N-acetylmuramic acid kinase